MKEIKKEFARMLRKEQTKAEKIIWEFLRKRKLQYKFRRQHVIEGFILDFYCHELKLGIEIDGGIHNKRKDYDRVRQEIIEAKGISVVRIKNEEISRNNKLVISRLKELIDQSLSHHASFSGGREREV